MHPETLGHGSDFWPHGPFFNTCRHPKYLPNVKPHAISRIERRASNEGGRGHIGHGLGQHRLPRARWAIEQHPTGRIDADLRVEFLVGQW